MASRTRIWEIHHTRNMNVYTMTVDLSPSIIWVLTIRFSLVSYCINIWNTSITKTLSSPSLPRDYISSFSLFPHHTFSTSFFLVSSCLSHFTSFLHCLYFSNFPTLTPLHIFHPNTWLGYLQTTQYLCFLIICFGKHLPRTCINKHK